MIVIHFTYDPSLAEDAVLLAEAGMTAGDARAFRAARDRIYEIADAEERERRFASLHGLWLVRLGLHRGVEQSVDERPEFNGRLTHGRVIRAVIRAEEGADLIDHLVPGESHPRPLLVLRLRPPTLVDADALRDLLRHELLHVADMIDPAFGYQRKLPSSGDGPAHDNLVRDRYRVLWDVTIDGRLARAGLANDRIRDIRWREFAATFATLGARRRTIFDEWFDRVHPTHDALMAFAVTPVGEEVRFAEARHIA